jgi:hypothetical protein
MIAHYSSLRENMLSDPKIVEIFALVLWAAFTAAAQTGPVVLTSPNGALETSFATVRGQSLQPAGGQLAYRVAFRGRPVLQWSNLGLALEGSPALGPAVRIESSQPSSQDETWTPVAGKANPIRNDYNAVTVQTVETAAEHHLMLDFHGAFKPDGMRRTYPNVLTREGVMGAEYNTWSARITPQHNVTLAFTRMLAGPMDYTPGGFDNGVPPKYITIARRRGNEWYVGSLTGWDARDIDVPLTFLGSGAYNAEIYADGPNTAAQPKDSVLAKRRVDARTVLKLKLAPGGGSAIRLVPVEGEGQ